MYHVTEAEIALFLLSCIESMLFLLVESHVLSLKPLLLFRCMRLQTDGFRMGIRASRAVLLIISIAVICVGKTIN
jgi:hypothetical protein